MPITRNWIVVTSLALVVVLVLVAVLANTSAPTEAFYDIAEVHEKNGRWELARAAWFTAKTRVGESSATGEIGRKAYYEYRIRMSYEKEGQHQLAAAHVQNALRTPTIEINRYLGWNGVMEIQKDLDDIQSNGG